MATYGATKAYLNYLSETLRAELAGTGVVVTALCPGPVPTEFQEVAGLDERMTPPKFVTVEALDCAVAGLHALKKGRARVIPGVMRAATALEAVPKPLLRPLLDRLGKKLRKG
jgi:short-subunit dehydrogenase